MDGHENFDENSSSVVSSISPPPSQSDSNENGPFDLALLVDNVTNTTTPNKHLEKTSEKDTQLDIWKRLSVDVFSAHTNNSSEFLM